MQVFRTFWRVLSIGSSERWLMVLLAVAGFGIATAQILEPVLFGRVIDALSHGDQLGDQVRVWLGLGILNAATSIFLSVASDRFAHRQRLRTMELAFGRTISLPYRYHSLQGSGKVVRTIQTGSDQVFYIILSFFRENLIALGCVVILVPLALSLDPRLATTLFGLALVYSICNWIVIRGTHVRQAQVEVKHQEMSARLIDVMSHVTIVRSFTRVRQEVELFHDLVLGLLRVQYPVLNWWGILNVITRLSAMIAMLTIVVIGSGLVHAGEATRGQIVTFVGFSTLLIGRLDQLSSFLNRIVGQMPTAKNLFDLIDHVSADEIPQGQFSEGGAQGAVSFEHVTFQFRTEGRPSQGVFDLTFAAAPGQTIALVGPTGAGKSTCLALLQRLYAPDSGRILIDGQDIQDLHVDHLCGAIATVFQDPGLFNRSIYDNILVGRPMATPAEVEEAARHAHAHDFIMARPGGYDFVVGERGLALSGGERQRVAIARAILKNAPILVLDEATSALDNETEKYVQAAMERLSAGKTTFVIAHRLSTVLTADVILVMSEGRIVQAGTFRELKETKGLFARLLQAGDLGETPVPADPWGRSPTKAAAVAPPLILALGLILANTAEGRFRHVDAVRVDTEEDTNSETYNDILSYRSPDSWNQEWDRHDVGYRASAGSLDIRRFLFRQDIKVATPAVSPWRLSYTESQRDDRVEEITLRELRVERHLFGTQYLAILGDGGLYKEYGDLGLAWILQPTLRSRLEIFYWSVDHYYNDKKVAGNDLYERKPLSLGVQWTFDLPGNHTLLGRLEYDTPVLWNIESRGYRYGYDFRQGRVAWTSPVRFWGVSGARDDATVTASLYGETKHESMTPTPGVLLEMEGWKGVPRGYPWRQVTQDRRVFEGDLHIYWPEEGRTYSGGIWGIHRHVMRTTSWPEIDVEDPEKKSPMRDLEPQKDLYLRREEAIYGLVASPLGIKDLTWQHGLTINNVRLTYTQDRDRLEVKYVAALDLALSDRAKALINSTWDLDQLTRDYPYKKDRPFRPWGGGNLQFMATF